MPTTFGGEPKKDTFSGAFFIL
ncbi:hypothetical protein [Staphylococcus aureus]